MKTRLLLASFALVLGAAFGCTTNNGPTSGDDVVDPPPDDDDDPPPDDDDDPPLSETCLGDNNCICPDFGACNHTCDQGAPECHVQGGAEPVKVVCNDNAECHIECVNAESCDVECGGSTSCHVTCPPTGCTVTSCVGDCVVSCGGDGEASLSGTTATCP
jgi:hypothetical protein